MIHFARNTFVVLILALLVTPCLAETTQDPYEFDAKKVAAKLADMLGSEADIQKYEDSLARLERASEAFTPKEAKQVLERLKAEETTIEQAEADFDNMIKDLRTTQSLGDPDGEFVQFMNDMQLKAQDEARAAEKDGDTEFAQVFTKLAAEFEGIRDRAIEARNEAIPALDFLKQNKRKYVRAKKIRAFAQIAVIADVAVEKAEQQSQEVQKAASALRNALEPATAR